MSPFFKFDGMILFLTLALIISLGEIRGGYMNKFYSTNQTKNEEGVDNGLNHSSNQTCLDGCGNANIRFYTCSVVHKGTHISLFPRKDYGEMEMTMMPYLIAKIIDMRSTSSFSTGDINSIG